jgi:FKBP-type peptidyl-prolyl cis-trans isomerase 2
MEIKKGSKVTLDYEGRLEDGTIFDTSKHGDHSHPLEFEAGSGQVIKGFDEAVVGMKKGEEKEFEIAKEDAYGEYNEELKRDIPRSVLPKDKEPKAGMTLVMQAPNGQQIPARIDSVDGEKVVLDLNHPLAGKKLIFKIKIVDVQ